MRQLFCGVIVVVVLWGFAGAAAGEVFVLVGGGRLEGELLNPEEKPRRTYVVQVAPGAEVTLEAAQVEQVLSVRPDEREYEKIRHRYPDTVSGQWALAQWCRQQRLLTQRDTHLERILELDPNHVEARRALGYSQIDGQWMKRDEVMLQRGYVRYKGRWRTRQEIELIEGKRKQELAEKEWSQKVERWRGWLAGDRAEAARQNILAIDDPAAVKALAAVLRNDSLQPARLLYIEALAKIGTPDALKALAVMAVEDPVEEVRLTCLDYLQKKKDPEVVDYFVGKLRSKDNRTVNLAAIALGRLKDPSAVGPLIDALVTSHKFKVGQGSPGSISTSFSTGGPGAGSGGLSIGGGPKIYTRQIPNQAVLDALVALTGRNFNFDERAWKAWFAGQKRSEAADARRN
jgi:hypothetical protein